MISSNDFRNGMTLDLDGQIFVVIEFLHVKPGKGSAFVRTKLKNVETGGVVERTFRAGEKVTRAHLERSTMQFLYSSADEYTFMDNDTFEQVVLPRGDLADQAPYLKEGMAVVAVRYGQRMIGVEIPNSVELTVVQADPGVRGDTASGGSKPARLETGLVVQVPFFINEGDVLRIDTRTGHYIERA